MCHRPIRSTPRTGYAARVRRGHLPWIGASMLVIALASSACGRTSLDELDDGSSGGQGPNGTPSCGDHTCKGDETCTTCALDCGQCPSCGDHTCNGETGESCFNCPEDCGVCPTNCGNGKCEMPGENCQNCAVDCGVCPGCGDGTCTPPNETCYSCEKDCGKRRGNPKGAVHVQVLTALR